LNPTQSRHTAEPRAKIVGWIRHAEMSMDGKPPTLTREQFCGLCQLALRGLAVDLPDNALAGIKDPAAFVKSVREAVAHHEEQTRVWGGEEGDENQVKYHTERASKLREHLGESNAA